MVLGDPHAGEPGGLGRATVPMGGGQCLGVRDAGALPGEQEQVRPYAPTCPPDSAGINSHAARGTG